MWKDQQFQLAILAAPVFWLGLWLVAAPEINLLWPLDKPWVFLSFALLYPVMEEVVFRGLIQDAAHKQVEKRKKRLPGPISLANLVTSILFVALHFIYHPPLAAASVIIPSLIFGYFKDRHHQLTSPIILHIFYNAGYFWLFTG